MPDSPRYSRKSKYTKTMLQPKHPTHARLPLHGRKVEPVGDDGHGIHRAMEFAPNVGLREAPHSLLKSSVQHCFPEKSSGTPDNFRVPEMLQIRTYPEGFNRYLVIDVLKQDHAWPNLNPNLKSPLSDSHWAQNAHDRNERQLAKSTASKPERQHSEALGSRHTIS